MKSFAKLLLISSLLVGVCGCPAQSSELRPGSAHFVIPAGTVLRVTLIDALSTDVSLPGDYFSASLAEDVVVEGRMLLEKGTRVRGHIFDLREPSRWNGAAALYLILTEITYGGKTFAVMTRQFAAAPDLATTADINVGTRGKDIHIAARTRIDFILAMQVEI